MRTTPVGQTLSHASPHGGVTQRPRREAVELFAPEFVSSVWGRRACELHEGSTPLFDERDVMDAIGRYRHERDQIRAVGDRADVVTALDGRRLRDPADDLLAQEHDLDSYLARVDALYRANDWAVAYFGLHAASTAIWDRAKSFADRLAEAIGRRPGGRVDVDCFIGRYRSTHTGIHVDHAHNFGATLRPGKTMLTWPGDRDDLVGLGPDEYESHRASSTALHNVPGLVSYFPEDHLHVAETPDRPSVNVNITFWEHEDTVGPHLRYLASRLCTDASPGPGPSPSGERELVGPDAANLAILRELLETGEWERRMMVAQLRWESSGHLGVARPVPASVRVSESTVQAPFSSVQWAHLSEGRQLVVAANGHCAAFSPSDAVEALLDRVISGATIDSAAVLNDRGSDHARERARLFTALVEWGALT